MQTSRATPIQVGCTGLRKLADSTRASSAPWSRVSGSGEATLVVELALGPRPAWRQGSAKSAWMTEQRAEQTMRALEERLRQAERTVHARARVGEPLTPRLRYALGGPRLGARALPVPRPPGLPASRGTRARGRCGGTRAVGPT